MRRDEKSILALIFMIIANMALITILALLGKDHIIRLSDSDISVRTKARAALVRGGARNVPLLVKELTLNLDISGIEKEDQWLTPIRSDRPGKTRVIQMEEIQSTARIGSGEWHDRLNARLDSMMFQLKSSINSLSQTNLRTEINGPWNIEREIISTILEIGPEAQAPLLEILADTNDIYLEDPILSSQPGLITATLLLAHLSDADTVQDIKDVLFSGEPHYSMRYLLLVLLERRALLANGEELAFTENALARLVNALILSAFEEGDKYDKLYNAYIKGIEYEYKAISDDTSILNSLEKRPEYHPLPRFTNSRWYEYELADYATRLFESVMGSKSPQWHAHSSAQAMLVQSLYSKGDGFQTYKKLGVIGEKISVGLRYRLWYLGYGRTDRNYTNVRQVERDGCDVLLHLSCNELGQEIHYLSSTRGETLWSMGASQIANAGYKTAEGSIPINFSRAHE